VLKGDYAPGFRAALYAKDLRNVVATLAEHETPAPIAAVVQQLMHATLAAGRGDDDTSVMARTILDLAGAE
jgi:3-hydroxyisobutyrate dehydrogenase-like beta-hydroxyacid dehydrogenase